MSPIRIMSNLWKQKSKTNLTVSNEILPQIYLKRLDWLHFDNEPRVQDKQQVLELFQWFSFWCFFSFLVSIVWYICTWSNRTQEGISSANNHGIQKTWNIPWKPNQALPSHTVKFGSWKKDELISCSAFFVSGTWNIWVPITNKDWERFETFQSSKFCSFCWQTFCHIQKAPMFPLRFKFYFWNMRKGKTFLTEQLYILNPPHPPFPVWIFSGTAQFQAGWNTKQN